MKEKFDELGRGMVEMLAVLAIIGLLSIFGISGYKKAMMTNKTNELLNAVTRRAVVVSEQRILNNEPSLESFDDTGDIDFDVDVFDNEQFSIFAEPVDAELCKSVIKADLPVRSILSNGREVLGRESACAEGDLEFIFNDDLSTEPHSVVPSCTEDAHCSGCQTCQNGICQDSAAKCATGSTCTNGACVCSDGRPACDTEGCCAANEVCVKSGSGSAGSNNKACSQPETTLACTSNAKCSSSKYCKITYTNATTINTAACTSKGSLTKQITFNDRTFWIGTQNISWTSAFNFCKAHGKSLATMASLGLANNELSCSSTANTNSPKVCALWDTLVAEATYGSYWLGESYSNEYARRLHRSGDSITTLAISSTSYPLCE